MANKSNYRPDSRTHSMMPRSGYKHNSRTKLSNGGKIK